MFGLENVSLFCSFEWCASSSCVNTSELIIESLFDVGNDDRSCISIGGIVNGDRLVVDFSTKPKTE